MQATFPGGDTIELPPDPEGPLAATAFKTVMDQTGLKLGKIAQPVRVALTGRTASPGIFEVDAILGKDKVLSRLQKAIRFIENKG